MKNQETFRVPTSTGDQLTISNSPATKSGQQNQPAFGNELEFKLDQTDLGVPCLF